MYVSFSLFYYSSAQQHMLYALAAPFPIIPAYVINISFMLLIHIMSLVLRGSTVCGCTADTTTLRYSVSAG